MTRVLVCGGRDYTDRTRLYDVLDEHIGAQGHHDSRRDTVIVGAARGADTLAEQWAEYAGCLVERYPADWKKYGKSAGPIRNQQMLDEGKPTLVIAFPGGPGTADMVRRAEAANVKVIKIGKYKT